MLLNLTLLTLILGYFLFAIYEQFLMEKRYGITVLKVRLLAKLRMESIVMLGFIWIAVYQILPQGMTKVTLYLIVMLSILLFYHSFIRYPVLLLKQDGCFLNNLYLPYTHIQTINISENGFLQLVLKNGKQLPIYIANVDDIPKILQFLEESGRITQPFGEK